ncbi:MAG: hypothetical protein N2235_00260 [Fischerella sp.]|nr:hypothetical protein [Fischerella sp.]
MGNAVGDRIIYLILQIKHKAIALYNRSSEFSRSVINSQGLVSICGTNVDARA